MNRTVILSVLSMLVITSCDLKTGQEKVESKFLDSVQVDNVVLQNENSETTVDYFSKANEFAKYVLGDKIRTHEYPNIKESPRHIEIFSNKGLERIMAFSDKDYPKYTEPNYYEHFMLFCLEYSISNDAEDVFQNLKNMAEIDFHKIDSLDQLTQDKLRFFHGESKPGGLIVQEGKWIFSLVETCRNTPLGGTWVEYEDLFISYFNNDNTKRIEVLNADCGKMKYKLEKR
jgi:hypothetical protein